MAFSKQIHICLCILMIFYVFNQLHPIENIGKKWKLQLNKSNCLSVCMMLPVTSRGIEKKSSSEIHLWDLPLVHSFLPSLIETVDNDYNYRLYIGYDYDDPFYDNETNWQNLLSYFAHALERSNRSTIKIAIRRSILYGIDRRITAIWNTLASMAYADHCDYYYPANDDMKLLTFGWTKQAILKLKECSVGMNFGIVAFRDIGACQYPTFHLTHRTHLDLHDGIYYPLPSHGAHQDPWIFALYRVWNCSFFLDQHRIANHVGLSKKQRYNYGDGNILSWVKRARMNLYQRLLFLSHFNQSSINSSNLYLHLDYLVPC